MPLLLGGFVVLLGLLGWLAYLLYLPGEEPFSLDEGVSVWPTEIIRLLGVFLSFFFLLFASSRLKKNREIIAEAFDLPTTVPNHPAAAVPPGKQEPGRKGFRNRISAILRRFCDAVNYNWEPVAVGPKLTMDELWQEYLYRDSLPRRLIRLAPIVFFYISLCALIFLTFEKPMTPVRGNISWLADKISLLLSVLFFVALNFYVFDVTRAFLV